MNSILFDIQKGHSEGKKLLAVLIDPDKFRIENSTEFFKKLSNSVTHVFVGGSTVKPGDTEKTVKSIKSCSALPVVLFPGDIFQVTEAADGLLFLSLISSRNPEFLIGQQVKAVEKLKNSSLEIISTGYILIDGGKESAVQKVTGIKPLAQKNLDEIVNTALAGQFMGKQLIYLEAGSGAKIPVSTEIISEVKKAINIPLLVGGGIRSEKQISAAYKAGADMIVVGTAFEDGEF